MMKINKLIIIGGPSCAGKSFLMKKIQQGDCLILCEQLGIAIPSLWLYVAANELKRIRQPIIERLVVHYSFFSYDSRENGFNYLHKLISSSNSVTILTLCVSHEILIKHNTLKLIKLFNLLLFKHKAYGERPQKLSKLWKIRKTYKDGVSVYPLYEKWFNFINKCRVSSHWVLDYSRSNNMVAHPYDADGVRVFTGVKEVMD